MKKLQPIRMCIMCRKREAKSLLLRLKLKDDLVIPYDGIGRSFYICDDCAKNPKKIIGLSKRYGQNQEYIKSLIESLQDRNR